MKNRTLTLVIMALMVAFLCVSAYISIPLPNGTHLTALNFTVMLIVMIFPLKQSLGILGIWFIMGLINLPVYIAGASGIGYVLGPYGGFTFSFVLLALIIPPLAKINTKHDKIKYIILGILAATFIDVVGTLYLIPVAKMSFMKAVAVGFLPFIVIDIIKSVVAALLVPEIKKALDKAGMEQNLNLNN
ncbi:MAG: biotin transporter BioY [Lachnospiraceae bacterium]|nr:biotin transporter BioY [Lachnospiraceae bacterium]